MGQHSARGPIEKKVTTATLGAFASSVVVAVLNAYVGNEQLLGSTPGWLQTLLIAFGPTAVTFLGGYLSPHTPRSSQDGTVGPKSL
jgi:hypothetical protein